jgi:hypothetical protein
MNKPITLIFSANSANPLRKKNKFLILDKGGRLIGDAKNVVLTPDRTVRRPPDIGRAVATYLAFHLNYDRDGKAGAARVWAAKSLWFGRKNTTDENLNKAILDKLKSRAVQDAIKGHTRVTFDDGLLPCFLMRDDFQFMKVLDKAQLTGVGWTWKPGEQSARYGQVSVSINEYQLLAEEHLTGGDGNL